MRSMAYTIKLSERAYADIARIVAYIQADSPQNATLWRWRLLERIASLDFSPRGCSLAPEDEYTPFEVRQALFGRYRILFTIKDDVPTVYVLTVRHGARQFMSEEELAGIE